MAFEKVLIVEDEPKLLSTLASRFRAEGYAVDSAALGRDGLYIGNEMPRRFVI